MATFFTMPKLGMNMTEGHIVRWLAEQGTTIHKGAPILEIETDKANNEVEAPTSGILAKILHEAGEDVPCNSVLAVILSPGEALPDSIPAMIAQNIAPKSNIPAIRKAKGASNPANRNDNSGETRIRVSPSAKKLARELGVDLALVETKGTQIKREDVQRAYDSVQHKKPKKPAGVSVNPYSGLRKLTGDAMAASSSRTAPVSLFLEADATGLLKQRRDFESSIGKVSFTILLAKLVAKTLVEFPYMNTQLSGNEIWLFEDVNIGIAVNSDKGLFVPILKNANKKSIEDLHNEFLVLAGRVQAGKANADDLSGGTFTITNLGAQEIESFVPIINAPECAILGVGAITEKAVVVNRKIKARPLVALTLVFDHRLVDGAPAAKFLQKIKHRIEGLAN